MLDEPAAFFGGWMTGASSTCKSGPDESFTPLVLRSIAVSPQPDCSKNTVPSTTARGHLSNGVSGCQGMPWSQELDGKELYGALDDEEWIWSREDPRFPGHRQHGQPILQHLLQVWYYADFKRGV